MKGFGLCRRCGAWAVERLRTHQFCWECDHSPENDPCLVPWSALEFRTSRIAARNRSEGNKHYFEDTPDFGSNEGKGE